MSKKIMTSSFAPITPQKVNKVQEYRQLSDENRRRRRVSTLADKIKILRRRRGKPSEVVARLEKTPRRDASKAKSHNVAEIASDLMEAKFGPTCRSKPSRKVNLVASENRRHNPKVARDIMPPATPLKTTSEPTCKRFGITYKRTRRKLTLAERVDTHAEKKWEEERDLFRGRTEWFVAHICRIQGNRPFKKWKGSVLDSVVGAFLTQNVSDYLSSTAFMKLAATFPLQSSGNENKSSNVELQKGETMQAFDDDGTPMQNIIMNPYKKLKKSLETEKESDSKVPSETQKMTFKDERLKNKRKRNLKKRKSGSSDWASLRKEAFCNGARFNETSDTIDLVDWEAVSKSDVDKIAEAIEGRGMHTVLAERIQVFLKQLVTEQGSLNLEWLRHVPGEKVREYLLSIYGIGLKSVECVRLLTLHQPAFPVDTNIGRICIRLGWVPLEPLPESLQLHLLQSYPVVKSIQNYLWPRLCILDHETLYELHCQMITFGKTFCTKRNPNCNACPLREECNHFKSAFSSARLALPGPEEQDTKDSTVPSASDDTSDDDLWLKPLCEFLGSQLSHVRSVNGDCEPIVEEPTTPEFEFTESLNNPMDDDFMNEISVMNLTFEDTTQIPKIDNEAVDVQNAETSQALVALSEVTTILTIPKLRLPKQLCTEHQVYELPDSHYLLIGMDRRVQDDPSPYLLAVWDSGETSELGEKSKSSTCKIQNTGECSKFRSTGGKCDEMTCFACRGSRASTVKGTFLIPCKTAVRGGFPLNGTYFQDNEVFADQRTSICPIDVLRESIWNLPKRTLYCGTSVTTMCRGLTTDALQLFFLRGM